MQNELREALNQVRAATVLLDLAVSTIARIEDRTRQPEISSTYLLRHADAISHMVPEGYDTILGHLARHHPDVLDNLDYSDPQTTVRDGWKLSHLCAKANAVVLYVDAPPCLRDADIKFVRAYPISILETRWV